MNDLKEPLSPISAKYLEYFQPAEFRFRWLEATGLYESLPTRANHLAARILTLWIDNESTTTTYDELCRITRLSIRTVQRGLRDLQSTGLLVARRKGSQISLTLVITDFGLDLLLAERERRRLFAGRRDLNDEWTHFVMAKVSTFYGITDSDTQDGLWRVLTAKIRSIIAHMHCHEVEAQKLILELTESPPQGIRDLPALLLSRASIHVRNYPHLARTAPIPVPRTTAATALDKILRNVVQNTSWPSDL